MEEAYPLRDIMTPLSEILSVILKYYEHIRKQGYQENYTTAMVSNRFSFILESLRMEQENKMMRQMTQHKQNVTNLLFNSHPSILSYYRTEMLQGKMLEKNSYQYTVLITSPVNKILSTEFICAIR